MKKPAASFSCVECGYSSVQQLGKCPQCGTWSSLKPDVVPGRASSRNSKDMVYRAGFEQSGLSIARPLSDLSTAEERRINTGIGELDRIFGGGIVPGSVILIGGEPGIGKSTLLLQMASRLGQDSKVLMVCGEESAHQVASRMDRLGLKNDSVMYLGDVDTLNVIDQIAEVGAKVVIVDSIQTMQSQDVEGAQGSPSQLKANTIRFAELAKSENIAVILVGHVTKDGAIAGPKVVEHLVDVVAYFEGERFHQQRILRCVKNRFGSTNEAGFFEMTSVGLREVADHNIEAVKEIDNSTPGRVFTIVLEGTRPVVAEIQALVNRTVFNMPRRLASGFDMNRLLLDLAILEKHKKANFAEYDVYVNVAGGMRVQDPGADLAVQAAVWSALTGEVISNNAVIFGEAALTGEIRAVTGMHARLVEAVRLGFDNAVCPKLAASEDTEDLAPRLKIRQLQTISEL